MRRTAVILGSLLLIVGAVWLLRGPMGRAAPAPARAASPVEAQTAPLEPAAPAAPPAAERARIVEPEPEVAEVPATNDDRARSLLRGTVLDAETTLPLPGHRLELLAVYDRSAERIAVRTDERGVFEVELDPAEYLALHRADPGTGPLSLAREVRPRRFELVPRDDGTPFEQSFLARHPPESFEVEVLYEDGRPAANAVVIFACTLTDPPFADYGNRTNEDGRVRMGVWDTHEFSDGLLTAKDDEGNVSEPLAIEAPFVPGLRRLVLAPGGELAVRVLESDGKPVAGRRILLFSHLQLGPRFYEETDADGRYRFEDLFTSEYTLSVWIPEKNRWDRRPVEVVRGDQQSIEVVLEEPEHPLAVSGRVVDENGQPIAGVQLAVWADERRLHTVRTEPSGAFRYYAQESPKVWIGANVLQQGDLFEPATLEVSFGTGDVLIRRKAVSELRTFEVEVYDNVTGKELQHFVATIDRGPGTERWSDSYAPRRKFELRLLPDARWRVKSSGYVTRELNLHEALDELGEGERLRIGLDLGLDHRFQLIDWETRKPIPGVSLRSETAGEVFSDENGRVHLRADHWSVYRITKEGYESEDWDPDHSLLWGRGGVYYLARL